MLIYDYFDIIYKYSTSSQKTIHSYREKQSKYYHFDHVIIFLHIVCRHAQDNTNGRINAINTHDASKEYRLYISNAH